jgi:peptidoglycan/xylan/chitin deacetylase (PgdA/CDA1 family)
MKQNDVTIMTITHFSSVVKHLASGPDQMALYLLQNRGIVFCSTGLLSIITVLILSNIILQPSFSEIISFGNNGTAHSNCNCVVFRLDDIQDYWISAGQLAVMNQFTSRNQSLTLGIIVDSIGEDSDIIDNVKGGVDSGLFELAIHGWNHEDYTTLSEEQQRNSLKESHTKMITLFGNTSEIFIPPFNAFNDDTVNAMRQVDMKILSAGTSSFNELQLEGSNNNNNNNELGIFYVPVTISFKEYYGDENIRNSLQSIFDKVTQSIDAYGYAVILIHPQDFMVADADGDPTDTLNVNEVTDLSRLIDLILSSNIQLGSFSKIIAEAEPDLMSTDDPAFDQFDSYIIKGAN